MKTIYLFIILSLVETYALSQEVSLSFTLDEEIQSNTTKDMMARDFIHMKTNYPGPGNFHSKPDTNNFVHAVIDPLIDYSEKKWDFTVSIFPNPTTGLLKVVINSLDDISNVSLSLHSVSGSEIYHKDKISNITEVDIRERENGVYILTMLIGTKNKSWKIIKN